MGRGLAVRGHTRRLGVLHDDEEDRRHYTMPKDVNGTGCIVQLDKSVPKSRCRRWQLRVSMGEDPMNPGRYITKTRRVRGTFTEAKSALASFTQELSEGFTGAGNAKLADFADDWVARKWECGSVVRSTHELDLQFSKLLRHCMGNPRLDAVDRRMVESGIAKLVQEGGIRGNRLSSAYILRFRKWLSSVMNEAVALGAVKGNPVPGSAKPASDSMERRPLSNAQIRELVAMCGRDDGRFALAACISAFAGLRRAEICGLKWSDVDFGTHTVAVERQLTVHMEETPTKGKRGRRDGLGDTLTRLLIERKMRQRADCEERGLPWSEDSYVIGRYGEPVSPARVTEWWRFVRNGIGAPDSRFHALRHTCLTNLSKAGVPAATIKDFAGHTDLAVTQGYLHSGDAMADAARAGERLVMAGTNSA